MTSRIPSVELATASGETREVLERTRRELGRVSKLHATMANAPAALQGYLDFRAALARGRLPAWLRGPLAVLVAEENGSRYCVSAHTCRAAEGGIAAAELAANQRAESADQGAAAALSFAAAVLDSRGRVTDAELQRVRAAGFDDGQIGEIIAYVALNCFANFFCQVARPDADFAPVPLTTDDSDG